MIMAVVAISEMNLRSRVTTAIGAAAVRFKSDSDQYPLFANRDHARHIHISGTL